MLTTLILIPTEFEAAFVRPHLQPVLSIGRVEIRLCGFGPIASGIRTAQLLSELRPKSCVLLGIAGTFRSRLTIGSAHDFHIVSCYGVGVGSGSQYRSASELGWRQWPEPSDDSMIGDVLRLETVSSTLPTRQLLTVCSASSSEQDTEHRLQDFPNAVAEDMESFSVALACRATRIPLTVIRGISNHVGDRDKSRWAVASALDAATSIAAQYVGSLSGDLS